MSAHLTLQYQHVLTYTGKEKSYNQGLKTKRSRKCGIKCQFHIDVYIHNNSNIWSIHNTRGENRNTVDNHIGHFKMNSVYVHTTINLSPKE